MDEVYMTEEEILNDFRELSMEETMNDNFRRMFQLMGLIYQNQLDIKRKLDSTA